ncbi:hypothetical protein JTB14_033006 [Gonioctena quinquepunctata]|nr:hypothetical protein JTB14_033006 [Gonioctena quinquepunctata]
MSQTEIDMIRRLYPIYNNDMLKVIAEYRMHLWGMITSDHECRVRGKNPPVAHNIYIEQEYYENFCIMKSSQRDDFEKLIGTTYTSKEYRLLKYREVRNKFERPSSKTRR